MKAAEVDKMLFLRRSLVTPEEQERVFIYGEFNNQNFHEGVRQNRLKLLGAFKKAVVPVLERHIDRRTLRCAVEVGTGTGFFARDLAPEWLKQKLLSIDINESLLKKAQEDPRMSEVACASVYSLPMANESVNAVIGYSSFDSFLYLSQALEQVKRILKKGGKLILFQDLTTALYQWSPTQDFQEQLSTVERYHQVLIKETNVVGLSILEGKDSYLKAHDWENPNNILARCSNPKATDNSFHGGMIWDRGLNGFLPNLSKWQKIEKWVAGKPNDVYSLVRMRYLVAQKK